MIIGRIKTRPPRVPSFLFLFLVAVHLSSPTAARAIPAFARANIAPCTLCHNGFPKLNHFGMEFLMNGYRMPGEEGKFLWDQPAPVSGRFDLSYQSVRDDWSPETPFSLGGFPPLIDTSSSGFGLTDWQLLAGGTLAPKISFMFQLVGIAERRGADLTDDIIFLPPPSKTASHSGGLVPLPGAPTLEADTLKTDIQTEQLFAQINDLVPDGALNVRAGRYHADNHLLSEPHRLTFSNYLVQIQTVLGPTLLSTTQGVEANGRLPGRFLYSAGIRNYGPQYDSKEDNEQRVGAFYGILGRMSHIASFSVMVSGDRVGDANVDSDDASLAFGGAASFRLGPVEIVPGLFRYTEGGDIRQGRQLDVTSGAIEVTYTIRPAWIATARYDHLVWDLEEDSSDRTARQYVLNVSWYPYPPVRLALEYSRLESENLVLISLPEGPMFLPAFADADFTETTWALLFELAF